MNYDPRFAAICGDARLPSRKPRQPVQRSPGVQEADTLPLLPTQAPSTSPQKYRHMKTRLHAHTVVANPRHSRAMSAVCA